MLRLTKGRFQLETTPATTVEINPTSSGTGSYENRLTQTITSYLSTVYMHTISYITYFRLLKLSPKSQAISINLVTVAELLAKNAHERTQNRFNCLARVKSIQTNCSWYYVLCPVCRKKMYPKKAIPSNSSVKMMTTLNTQTSCKYNTLILISFTKTPYILLHT